ncbi:DUF3857 domain-containing protein [Odoribacter lunatus]|uniref:DUF3857 domain-containing protein n=1 Tax=Odoribacter lunatus TaxID=2941335 RepID=UPI002040B570|nr:DUF3857 domain-containing protein [Odoribacter lunatus]
MTISTKYILLIGVTLLANFALATPEATFKKIKKEFTILPDSTIQINYFKELEINSLMAINRLYGESFIIYNPDYQKLQINTSYTLLANGDTIFTPTNAFNEVLPAFAANAPAYNHLKEMVITHTGLEPNSRIMLDYTILSSYTHLDIDEILQEECPIEEYQIIINIPENQQINFQLLNLSTKPQINQTIYGKQYVWIFRDLAPKSHETFQVKNQNDIPHFIANNYTSTKEPINILKDNFHFINDKEIALFTKKLIQNCENDLDKVFTIKDFITHQNSTTNIPSEYLNWKIRTPKEVLDKAYGTIFEKINLFISMLQCIGFKSSVVLIYPEFVKNNIPGLKTIRQAVVYTQCNGIPLFLSVDGSEITAPELRGDRDQIFLLSEQEINPLTVLPASGNIYAQFNIKITPVETFLSGNLSLSGGLIQPLPNQLYQEKIKHTLNLPGDSLKIQYNHITPFQNKLSFKSQSQSIINQNYIFYHLPEIGIGVNSWKLLPLNSKRHSMLEIPYAIEENYEYIIQLAPGLKLLNSPQKIYEKHDCGSLYIDITQKADKIFIQRKLHLPKALITPKTYKSFRKILNAWDNEHNKILIINAID